MLQVLTAAARGGTWAPDFLLISSMVSPKLFELILVLPEPFFWLAFSFLGLFPSDTILSPGQMDIAEGRKSMIDWHLSELVEVY